MNIFLSYPSEERTLAEEIQLALVGAGHQVFFDKQSLPGGGDYQQRIKQSVDSADLFVFLITADSVAPTSFALTELAYARERWPHPKERVLPVRLHDTPIAAIPPYLKAVTLVEPEGNVAAAVVAAVARLLDRPRGGVPPETPPPPAPSPSPPASASRTPMFAALGAVLLLAVAAAVYFGINRPPSGEMGRLEALVDAAKDACASNTSIKSGAKVSTGLDLLLDKVRGDGGIAAYRDKHVGANTALPPELQLPENDQVRDCMKRYMPGIFKALGIDVPVADTGPGVPNPLQLRFSYEQPTNPKVEIDPSLLRVDLQVNRRIFSDNAGRQEGGYYSYNVAYPDEGSQIDGSVIRALRHSGLTETPAASLLCLRRPKPLLPFPDQYVHIDCAESAVCKLHAPSPKWLEACAPEVRKTSRGFSLISEAVAAEAVRRWAVPSAQTLARHKDQLSGVGYTIFTIETDAFRDPQVIGVEVDIRANGTPILEDGLAPELRPVATDASRPFKYEFALESLDFEGAQAGCEAVQVSLRPRLASGSKTSEAMRATLAYVALRDKEPESVAFGKGTLRWSAHYVVPAAEWSHEAFITSVSYATTDGEAAAARARERSVVLKQAFDRLGVTFQGRPVVGVIRPPLTLSGTTLAYGLAAGVVQPTGQVRFTFSAADASAIGDRLLVARAAAGAAQGIIERQKYIYRAAGNAERRATPTPPGVCRHVPA